MYIDAHNVCDKCVGSADNIEVTVHVHQPDRTNGHDTKHLMCKHAVKDFVTANKDDWPDVESLPLLINVAIEALLSARF